MGNSIFDGYLNEAKDMLAQACEVARKTKGQAFRDAARDIAFERGWDLGWIDAPAIDREYEGLVAALLYMSNVQAMHGLEPLGVMIGALESGRQARVDERMAAQAAAGGDLDNDE